MQRFDIFVSQTIDLANSLIIKSENIAEQMNQWVLEHGTESISANRATWRYYLHLAGMRHPLDVPISIKSLDTGEIIELTPESLNRHKKTGNVYRSNPKYVDVLIEEYPAYSVYIHGCFRPIPLKESIAAQDCTVLLYDTTLVEPQELSIIGALEEWMRAIHYRYMAEGWKVHNDCFVLVFYTILYSLLPGRMLFERFKNNHTPEAHSFFITEFLASHQNLHEYIMYMTREQMFSTYRNVRTWERSSGQGDTFDWLVDVFFTGWDMPAVAYSVAQLNHDPTTGEDADVVPKPIAFRRSLNFLERVSGRDLDLVPTEDVILKEYPLASANPRYMDAYRTDLDTKLSLAQSPVQPTKLVEITAIDPESLDRYDRVHSVWNEWVHMVMLGKYNTMHEIVNPTNGDTLRVTSKELIALYLYAGLKGYAGVELIDFPTFAIHDVLIKRWVPFDEMERHLVPNLPGRFDSLIHYYTDTHYEQASQITDAGMMYDAAMAIWTGKQQRWVYGKNRRKLTDRAASEQLFKYHYRDYQVTLDPNYANYDMFFKSFGMDYRMISNETWQDIATSAFNTGTDYENKRSISQSEIQRAMVGLMTQLSSYSIHFASKMSSGNYEVMDPVCPILDDIGSSSEGSIHIMPSYPEPVKVDGKSAAKVDVVLDVVPRFPTYKPGIVIPSNHWYMFNLLPSISVSVSARSELIATGFLPDVVDVDENAGG